MTAFPEDARVEVHRTMGRRLHGRVYADAAEGDQVLVVVDGKAKPKPFPPSSVRLAERPRPPTPALVVRGNTERPEFMPPTHARKPARRPDYLAFVREHACQNCGAKAPSEAHHWARKGRAGGTGQKPSDFRTVALCSADHLAFHGVNGGALPGMGPKMTRVLFHAWQVDLLEEWAELEPQRHAS